MVALLFLAPRLHVQPIAFNGRAVVYADLWNPDPRNVMLQGLFDPEFFQICGAFLRQGGVFLDIGASFGFCTFGLLSALEKVDVEAHLFEANPLVCWYPKKTLALYPHCRVVVNNVCVGDRRGRVRLRIVGQTGGQSHVSESGEIGVESIALGEYMDARGIVRASLAKLDIEGYEPLAVRGAEAAMREGRVPAVFTEVKGTLLKRYGYTVEGYYRLLRGCGYRLFFVRARDLERVRGSASVKSINVNGIELRLCEIDVAGEATETDIIGIHRAAGWL